MNQAEPEHTRSVGPARKVGLPLALGIALLPGIFVWFLLRQGHSTIARAAGFGWTASLVILFVILPGVIRALPDPPPPGEAPAASGDAATEGESDTDAATHANDPAPAEVAAAPPAPSPELALSDKERRGMHCLNN